MGYGGVVGDSISDWAIDRIAYGFLDTGLNPALLNAYHALAIDEKRAEFPPTLWKGAAAPGQTVEQVWFCGGA